MSRATMARNAPASESGMSVRTGRPLSPLGDHARVERDAAKKGNEQFAGELLRRPDREEVGGFAAVRAAKAAHVPNQPEQTYLEQAGKGDCLARVHQADAPPLQGQAERDVDGDCGLADAACAAERQ